MKKELLKQLMDKEYIAGLIETEYQTRFKALQDMMGTEFPQDKDEIDSLLSIHSGSIENYLIDSDNVQWQNFPADLAPEDNLGWFDAYESEISSASSGEYRPAGWAVDITAHVLRTLSALFQ